MTHTSDELNDKLHWYKDAVIYEVHIKAYRDSNGDGIGDFGGLLLQLDYLQGLGVTAIWLLPFYPSPLRDDGYDIADYYTINPSYGDIEQFKELLKEAHKRNLRVITELVINHTSDQHPWFQRARKAPKGSPERDYYVWSDDNTRFKDARIIFQDFEASNWAWDPEAQQYYWHRFFHHQPDLNFDNPAVQAEVFKIIDYWCALGVDGFRLDAVPYLFERDGTNCENLPETHVFLKKLRSHVDARYPGTLLLAEANMWPEDSASYFGDGDGCQMNYHFPIMPRMFMALQMEDRYPITDIFDQTPAIPGNCQWAIFLRNHDELTLEMVTDEERDYMYKMYVKDPRARINLGIRQRLAPLMENNRRKIELLNYLLFSLPGTPVIYYGDEIGMGDNYYLGDRDGVRTPMQWSADRNAGFSQGNPQRLYLPVITDPAYHYEHVNVENETANRSSLLWAMRRMLHIRKRYKAFSRGSMQFVDADNPKVLAFTRVYQDEVVLVIVNLSRHSQPAELNLEEYKGYQLIEAFSNNKFPAVKAGMPYFFTLSQYECQWFSLIKPGRHAEGVLQALEADTWEDVLLDDMNSEFTTHVLPVYLQKMRWFGGKARTLESIRIAGRAVQPGAGGNVHILLLETVYNSGLPEMYQLAVAWAEGPLAAKIKEEFPLAVISDVQAGDKVGLLYDAIYSPEYRDSVIEKMAGNAEAEVHEGRVTFSGSKMLTEYMASKKPVSKVLNAEQSNSSVIYDNAFILKFYRKVDRSLNPDLEINRFITEKTTFSHIPAFTGAIEWQTGGGTIVLGMMQELVESNQDGWAYMMDRLAVYNERILTNSKLLATLPPKEGTLQQPAQFAALPEQIKDLLDVAAAERVRLLGVRTGEMHIALATSLDDPAFRPEEYSLHYQRSLFSSFLSLVRGTFHNLAENLHLLPEKIRPEAEQVLAMKDAVLLKLKRIYARKFDIIKIRVHGDYHLGQVLFTGKDILILDFEGEPARSYSERRLKRTALRDVAGMMRSLSYAAYGSLFLGSGIRPDNVETLIPFAELWQHYMKGFYLDAYLKTVEGTPLIPEQTEDLNILLEIFMLEKAIYELNYELNNRPDWVIIPLRGIKAIMS
ncbi:MAG: maltose alpha-D-glucosyltransferase [Taibaiella sp.]|nr:maltose alpha-D-glucosyltransferase [Taibaiella sp.]